MKYREKIVQIEFLDDEERVIRRLQAVYNQSLKYITQKANALQEEIYKIQDKYNSIEDEQERETLKSMERSKVYQKQYQDALKAQVNSILDISMRSLYHSWMESHEAHLLCLPDFHSVLMQLRKMMESRL